MKNLQSRLYNVIATVLISAICFYLYHQSGALDNAGMAALILNWIPLMIGLFTLILFLVLRFFTERYAWIITLLGALLNIAWLVMAYLSTTS